MKTQIPTPPPTPAPDASQLSTPSQQGTSSVEELMSGLQPLKPPVEIPATPEPFPAHFLIGGLLGAVTLAVLIYFIYKHFRKTKKISPRQKALQSLASIKDSTMESNDYIMAVSHILKGYLEDQGILPAIRQTTEEFLNTLKTSDKISDHRDTLRKFLEQCDLIKFACGKLAPSQRDELAETARHIIQESHSSENP